MTSCSDVVRYQGFGGPYCLPVSYHITARHPNPEDHVMNLHCRENLKSHNKIRFVLA